ncbi:hypothetical protein [Kutzneria sp. NPDC051319]|uniref:hypothetical protein n=1 Tax=Kutzneria sp. NPDC051319 TaxID=3155047 RepID=UPI00343071C3
MTGAAAGTMSRAEVAVLLALVVAYGGPVEAPTEETVAQWRDALAGYSLGECQAAVIAHAQTSPETLSPFNLIRRIRAARRTKGNGEALRRHGLDAEQNARNAATIHRGMAKIREAMGWPETGGAHDDPEENR